MCGIEFSDSESEEKVDEKSRRVKTWPQQVEAALKWTSHLRAVNAKLQHQKDKVSNAMAQAQQAQEEAEGYQEEGRQLKEANESLIEENQDL